MEEVALPLLILIGLAVFVAVPSAFLLRAGWRGGRWQRGVTALVGLFLAAAAASFSLSSPMQWIEQWRAWVAFFLLWLFLLLAFGVGLSLLRLAKYAVRRLRNESAG